MRLQLKQRANITSLTWRKAMLNQAYTAVRQTQEKNFPNPEFLAIKKRFKQQSLHIEVEIASCSVWAFNWNLSQNSISGMLNLEVRPKLVDSKGNVMHEQRSSRRFRVEEPLISKELLQERFFEFLIGEIKGLQGFVDRC